MREQDFEPFVAMLDDVASLLNHGKPLTSGHKSMFFRAMSAHSLDAVRCGFDEHVKDPVRGRFMPAPADLLAQIEGLVANDGRPGPEEAWACALRSADEDNTVVWTDETAKAWAVAVPVLDGGDQIGARMAFKEAYVRLTDEARRARRPPHWLTSLGFDPKRRDEALAQAFAAGRIGGAALPALPAPEESFAALARNPTIPAAVLEKLYGLKTWFASRADAPSAGQIDRERTAALKENSAAKVATYRDAA